MPHSPQFIILHSFLLFSPSIIMLLPVWTLLRVIYYFCTIVISYHNIETETHQTLETQETHQTRMRETQETCMKHNSARISKLRAPQKSIVLYIWWEINVWTSHIHHTLLSDVSFFLHTLSCFILVNAYRIHHIWSFSHGASVKLKPIKAFFLQSLVSLNCLFFNPKQDKLLHWNVCSDTTWSC